MSRILLLILYTFIVRSNETQSCGIRPKNDLEKLRIVGGHNAKDGLSWPWMASIRRYNEPYFVNCGATLINDNWVLVAAHCVQIDDNPLNWLAVFGDYNITANESTKVVVHLNRIIIHPKFSLENGIFNDIALLQLNQTLDFNGKHSHLGALCLPKDTNNDITECVITGWGRPQADGQPEVVLQEAVVPIVDPKTCFQVFQFKVDLNTNVCAGGLKNGGLGTCIGDSGGPLQCRGKDNQWYQLGITSWGEPCAKPGIPDVFTRVSAYYEWIEEVINKSENI